MEFSKHSKIEKLKNKVRKNKNKIIQKNYNV
jgi:hypothetical protein